MGKGNSGLNGEDRQRAEKIDGEKMQTREP